MSAQRSQEGFLLVTTMLVTGGLLMLVAVSLSRSTTELMATNRFVAMQQAFHVAEAGVDAAIAEFARGEEAFVQHSDWTRDPNPSHTNQGTPPCREHQDPSCRHAIATATGIVTVQVDDFAGVQSRITATGVSGAMPSVSCRLLITGSTAPETVGEYALFAGKWLTFGEGGGPGAAVVVDSYDSRLGAYGGINTGYEGHVGISDGYPWDMEELTVGSRATLHGLVKKTPWIREGFRADATCSQGAGSDPACAGEDIEIIPQRRPLPPIEVPAELTSLPCQPAAAVCATCARATLTLASGDHCYASVAVGSGGRLILEPGARLYLAGDGNGMHDVLSVLQGTVEARGDNAIFAEVGVLDVHSATGLSTLTGNPADLQIRLKGNRPRAEYIHFLHQGSPFHGVLYLQQGQLVVNGFGAIFGPHYTHYLSPFTDGAGFGAIVVGDDLSLAGYYVNATNTMAFHRDVAVQNVSLSGAARGPFRITAWSERAPVD